LIPTAQKASKKRTEIPCQYGPANGHGNIACHASLRLPGANFIPTKPLASSMVCLPVYMAFTALVPSAHRNDMFTRAVKINADPDMLRVAA
jgi:hypothetical protein